MCIVIPRIDDEAFTAEFVLRYLRYLTRIYGDGDMSLPFISW